MNRIDRLHAILTTLQSKRVVKAEELATRFEISLRTVYRDLKALEEGGIPIGAEAGVGYFLTEGFHLPPIMFTHEEARALLLAGKFIEKNTDQPTMQQFQNALTKVRAVLDSEKKDDLEGLENKIVINPFPSYRPSHADLWLHQIKQALSDNRTLELEYAKMNGTDTRSVEPLGLSYYGSQWHLIAYCRLRKDYRDFRLDRIKNLAILPERFIRAKHPSVQEYFDKMIKEFQMVSATIKVHSKVYPFIQETKYTMGLIEETTEGDWTEMKFATYSCNYFGKWLLTLGTSVEIISPLDLKSTVAELVNQLNEKYKNK